MPIRRWMTCLTMAAGLLTVTASCGRAEADATIRIDLDTRYQTIDGFGTCMMGWSRTYDRLYATEAFQRAYAETVGCSILRINVWGPVMQVPEDNWRDITYKKFYLKGKGHRARTFLEFARAVKAINPDIKLIGSVWTPPPWMKMNNSITGDRSDSINGNSYEREGRVFTNRVKPELFPHFAKWLVEMVKLHEAEGVPFYAISIGNEVMFTQTFDSCVWTPRDYATVVRLVGELLDQEGLSHVKIFGPETMTGHNWPQANPAYVDALMSDPQTARHFDIFATHGYVDGFVADESLESDLAFRELVDEYDRPIWMTEGGTGGHDWPVPLNKLAAMLHNALVTGHVSAFVPWQISVEKEEDGTHSLMLFDRLTPKTHVAQHYFKFIRPGAIRVDASPGNAAVKASAYLHEGDRTLTIVLTNPTEQDQTRTLTLEAAPSTLEAMAVYRTSATEGLEALTPIAVVDSAVTIQLPAQCIVTLQGEF